MVNGMVKSVSGYGLERPVNSVNCGSNKSVHLVGRWNMPRGPLRHYLLSNTVEISFRGHRASCICTATDGDDSSSERSKEVRSLPRDFSLGDSDAQFRVRQLDRSNPEEIRRVVTLQAEGFHKTNPVPFFDSFLKTSFRAEVLSEMMRKIRFNPADRFVCLVAEYMQQDNYDNVIGVVEVSYIDEKEVLQSLEPGTPGVVYLASMTVDPGCRNKGVAKLLLKAAFEVTKEWNEEQCVLHVYQDNSAAVELYKGAGFLTIFQDAAWLAKVAVRPRLLMKRVVRSNSDSDGNE
eukprot:jgi/Picsp_1/876/NSC_04364-R1_gcn5-related n-acetyltransferase family-like protein